MIHFSNTTFDLAREIITKASAQNIKIAGAESCTGGLISAVLTSIPGSSSTFEFNIISYANDAKTGILNVKQSLIQEYGAVSKECAEAMSAGTLKLFSKDDKVISFAVTGIAGPDGSTVSKPVGLVFIAISNFIDNKITIIEKHFSGDRASIRMQAVHSVLTNIVKLL